MRIQIRYFASLREALGPSEGVDWSGPCTVGQLRQSLVDRGGRHADLLGPQRAVRCAVNQVLAATDDLIPEGAEVAFFPPVTGG